MGVVGLGYLGAVHAACMAELGHQVVGLDVDARNRTAGEDLLFTTRTSDLKGCDVVFVCVGTPKRKGELAADTSQVTSAVRAVVEVLDGEALVVGKSTVPVGTAASLAAMLAEEAPALSASPPRGPRRCSAGSTPRPWRPGRRWSSATTPPRSWSRSPRTPSSPRRSPASTP